MPPYQTDHLDIVLLDPNQTGKADTVNEAINSLAQSLGKQLVIDLAVATSPHALPYEEEEGGNKTHLQTMGYNFTGALAGAFEVVHPSVAHFFFVNNDADNTVTVRTAAGTGVEIPSNATKMCYCDGVNVIELTMDVSVPDASISNAKLANMAAWTIKARNDAAAGQPSDVAVADITEIAIPTNSDYLFMFLSTGEIRKVPWGNLPGHGGTILREFNHQAGAYTLAQSDANKYVRIDSATDVDVTVPDNATVAIQDGSEIAIRQAGNGIITLVAGTGVIINRPPNTTLRLLGKGAQISLTKVEGTTDEWDLTGDLEIVT